MCGFVGFLGGQSGYGGLEDHAVVKRMAEAVVHRGPDDAGYWCDVGHRIGLGHRRLSILDLSAAGHQPMSSRSQRYVIAFNGEIYNHLELRRDLEKTAKAMAWRGHSDTETLLAGFDEWGIERTVVRLTGMFAFSIWDREALTLTLGRDRLGEKPIYYGWQGTGSAKVFLFGSELKALRAHPAFRASVNRDALCTYFRQMAVAGEASIFEGVRKLAPGTLLTVSQRAPSPISVPYWSAVAVAQKACAQRFDGSSRDAVDALEALLIDAVRKQMVADVPLGAFLSGGVDSSAVVALMQSQTSRRIKTFSIGFHEARYNEAEYAKAVAQHVGTDHTEMYVSSEQAMSVIPLLPSLYDEPFGDSSQIPTFLVSRLARQQVTVALSGDGGDELFAGYNRYQLAANLWTKLSRVPLPLRRVAAWAISRLSPQLINRLAQLSSSRTGDVNVGDKLHKGAGIMGSRSVAGLYHDMMSNWQDPGSIVINGYEPVSKAVNQWLAPTGLSGVESMMLLDTLTYLPDDILTKVDRASMGVSLETRVPFLDHRVVEFAMSLPPQYKLRTAGGKVTSKWVLRQVLHRHVPQSLIDRPKMGFGVPVDDWLRGPLRDWAEDLLSETRLKREGFLNPAPIRLKWAEHLSGHRNWQNQLWSVLMFQAWLGEQSTWLSGRPS